MKFDKLRLTGFKSFVDATDVVIEAGLTGVVGPNGCGKSNLVEALRWVMGEASYKSVRGASMDDVIFAGSGRRPKRDTAEVTLFLDNSDRSAPAEINNADHLEVSRRITRALGSDYRVNGKSVRARDVQLLFADAATGSRSPSMVRQGQVAELIAAKPTERRNILEEAAGIAGLRARKHEASLKLNAAETNLSRVEDVAAEVEKQVETLRRQAKQARRYRTVSAEIRTLEATVHHLRWHEARTAVKEAENAVAAARVRMKEAAETQSRTATEHAAAEHRMPGLRKTEAAAVEERQRARAALTALEERERALNERLDKLKSEIAALEKDLARQDGAKADAAAAVERLAREEADLTRANTGADDRIAALEAVAAEAQRRVETADAAASEATERAAAVQADRAAAEAAHTRAMKEAEKAAAEVHRLEKALSAAQDDDSVRRRNSAMEGLATAETAEAEAARAEEEARAEDARAQDALAAAEGALPPLKTAEADAAAALGAVRSAIAERETEAKALERLTATLSKDGAAVLDSCTVAPGYEAAFAAALGDDLEAPVSESAPARWAERPPSGNDPALPRGAEPLASRVSAPAALTRRLAQVGLVEDGALSDSLATGQRLVSTEGALWRWDGFARAAGAPSAAAERLSQKNRLAALEGELADLAPKRDRADADLARARDALSDGRQAESAARNTVNEARKRLSAARDALSKARKSGADARQKLARTEEAAKAAEAEEARLAAALEAAGTTADTARATARETAAARDAASTGEREAAERDRLKGAAREALKSATDATNAVEAERRATHGRTRRLERIATELTDWRQRLSGADGHRDDLATRLETARAELAALADAPDETFLERRRLTKAAEAADAAEAAARAARETGEAEERASATAAREGLEALSTARETAGRAEERMEAARTRLGEVESALVDALECRPEQAFGVAGLEPCEPLPDRAACEGRLDKLKAERERLGGVNLLAEQELGEIEDRRGTMLAERDDLLAAIEKLRTGITTLNREARERLLASFDAVNAEFQRLFTHLFGGGEAHLSLTEAEDPLDAGLDIVARPPGKKSQVLSLLSGGEQTLTATALIFAVFNTNPAPICVLDEIDAPLDDANVERFCALLDEMTRRTETRFLIITHNPLTMARMHRLYGVTMVEKGVSQLVSVSLEDAEELRQSA